MARRITQGELLERTAGIQTKLIDRWILWFERKAVPWRNPHVAVRTDKKGNIVRSKTTGRAVIHTYKGGPGGEAELLWKAELRKAFQDLEMPKADGKNMILRVSILCLFSRTSAMPKTKRLKPQPKITRPDVDNLRKCICDAMIGPLCDDDSIIYDGKTTKWHVAHILNPKNEKEAELKRPGTIIIIDYCERWNDNGDD